MKRAKQIRAFDQVIDGLDPAHPMRRCMASLMSQLSDDQLEAVAWTVSLTVSDREFLKELGIQS